MGQTFKTLGPKLLKLGYDVLPVTGKRSLIDNWQEMQITEEVVEHWASNGEGGKNVGVRCGKGAIPIYGADVDFYDLDVARAVRKSFAETFGEGLIRVGNAPKSMMIYRGKPGHQKINSPVWRSPDGQTHKFEFLGDGQQFAAYGTHPDTGKPYRWPNGGLDQLESWELPELDCDAVLTWVRDVLPTLIPSDWEMISGGGAALRPVDDILDAIVPQLDVSREYVDKVMSVLDPDMGHDEWATVGMGLHHQFAGSEEGLAIWDAWSKPGATYDGRLLRTKWASFGQNTNRRPVTFASVIKMAHETPAWVELVKAEKEAAFVGWQSRIEAAEDARVLQDLIEREIAYDRELGTVDLAALEVAAKARFNALGVTIRAEPLRRMFKRKGRRQLPDVSAEGRPQETEDNVRVICENHNIVIRYNVIKKEDEILIPGASWSIDNRRSATLTALRSLCHKEEISTKYLKNIVTLLADRNQFNPAAEFILSRPWDGVDRLPEFYATVQENPEECSNEVKVTIMRRWMVSAVAAAMSPNGIMARGVLVFQGTQYAGKTRWIDALVPKDLELVKIGRALNVHDKDSVKQILSGWIAELGELDATFKRSDIAALKAFISNDSDELRRPYAEAESQFARRTVFAASVNEKQFLQDATGNSRFWVLPINAIDHAHTLDMQQVWAQFYTLWKAGEQHYLTPEEMAKLNDHNEEFSAPDPIAEMVATHLDWEAFDPTNCNWMTVSDVLRWIGHKNPTKWDTTTAGRTIIKLNGGMNRKSHGKRLSAVPLQRKMIGWETTF